MIRKRESIFTLDIRYGIIKETLDSLFRGGKR